jgi:hypothetical protein
MAFCNALTPRNPKAAAVGVELANADPVCVPRRPGRSHFGMYEEAIRSGEAPTGIAAITALVAVVSPRRRVLRAWPSQPPPSRPLRRCRPVPKWPPSPPGRHADGDQRSAGPMRSTPRRLGRRGGTSSRAGNTTNYSKPTAVSAKRTKKECGPITDPQLRQSCLASFRQDEPFSGSSTGSSAPATVLITAGRAAEPSAPL